MIKHKNNNKNNETINSNNFYDTDNKTNINYNTLVITLAIKLKSNNDTSKNNGTNNNNAAINNNNTKIINNNDTSNNTMSHQTCNSVHLLSSFAKNKNTYTRRCNKSFVNKERSHIDDKKGLSKK